MTLKIFVSLCLVIVFFSGCGHPDGYDTAQIQKASLQISKEQTRSQVIHFDYDIYNKRLIRKFETISDLNPNKLEIAIQNFLAKTNFRGNYSRLKFDYSDFDADLITFYFKGHYDFERIDDEEIFKKALELTITNYTENVNINLVFNDNKF